MTQYTINMTQGCAMDEPTKKRVDESWKEQVEREKQSPEVKTSQASPSAGHAGPAPEPDMARRAEGGLPEARFDLFIQGLAMEALIALGDVPHPATRKQAVQLAQAKYLIDLLGLLEEKTKGNLTAEEEHLFKDLLYQLRMRYLTKSGGVAPA